MTQSIKILIIIYISLTIITLGAVLFLMYYKKKICDCEGNSIMKVAN